MAKAPACHAGDPGSSPGSIAKTEPIKPLKDSQFNWTLRGGNSLLKKSKKYFKNTCFYDTYVS